MSAGRLSIAVLQWAVAWLLLWRIPTPSRARARTSPGRSAIVVPARDEADNLARLLPSLEGEDVVVVDDGSTDGTGAVAAGLGAAVVHPGPLPEGWTGKAWACAAGAGSTTAERLVFLDADVVVEPGGLARILAAHDDLVPEGLLSVQPWHAVERPYEQLSAFFNLVGMAAVDAFTPLGARVAPTGAFGPCLVLRRSVYEAAGGHADERVRGDVLDDVALARAVRRTGAPVVVLGGRGAIRFRMYPHGVAQLVEGWTKNMAGGARGTRPTTLLLVVAWVGLLLVAPWTPLLYLACVVQLLVLLRRIGRFSPLTALLYPIPLAFFLAVFVRSLVLTLLRREVRWRGRTVRT